MNLTTVVLTAPRPISTLKQTLKSLAAAGVPRVEVYEDRRLCGHFCAYMGALRRAVVCDPGAAAYFIVEDDVVFCRGLYEYLRATLWPGPVEEIALCSPYSPAAYRQGRPGWDATQSGRGLYLAGSQAWVFPAAAAREILAQVAPLCSVRNADWEIGRWADATARAVWYHTPSLAQHVGVGNSALDYNEAGPLRLAADFVGEGYDATALLGESG